MVILSCRVWTSCRAALGVRLALGTSDKNDDVLILMYILDSWISVYRKSPFNGVLAAPTRLAIPYRFQVYCRVDDSAMSHKLRTRGQTVLETVAISRLDNNPECPAGTWMSTLSWSAEPATWQVDRCETIKTERPIVITRPGLEGGRLHQAQVTLAPAERTLSVAVGMMDVLQGIHDQLEVCLGKPSLFRPGDLETPFSRFSTIDVVPDILFVHAVVTERKAQLAVLSSQMALVDSAIQKLAAVRARLGEDSAHVRQSLLAHQALVSPARRIPPEILGEVFHHCLPQTSYPVPRDVESPMMLTRVCRRWRAVAISTPRLWSSLSVHLERIVCDDHYRHGCEAWLARARSVPLSIRVFNDLNMIADDPTLILPVAHWLRPLIAHCGDLWWHGPCLPTLLAPETGSEIDLPLARLRITTYRDSPSVHLPGSAGRLRSASLQCLNHDLRSLDGIRLPWDHLVDLTMHFSLFSSTLLVQLLARCPHLRTLVASCLSADAIAPGALRALAPGLVRHPTLRRIEIKVIYAGLDALLDVLTLPALEELDVCFCRRERDAWPHALFVDMVRRSRCALRRLTVRSHKHAAAHFGEYVAVIPGLAVYTTPPDPLAPLAER